MNTDSGCSLVNIRSARMCYVREIRRLSCGCRFETAVHGVGLRGDLYANKDDVCANIRQVAYSSSVSLINSATTRARRCTSDVVSYTRFRCKPEASCAEIVPSDSYTSAAARPSCCCLTLLHVKTHIRLANSQDGY